MTFDLVPHTLIASNDALAAAIEGIGSEPELGLDLETTGLDPRRDAIRLVAVAAAHHCWVFDVSTVELSSVLTALAGKTLIGHNLAFDLGFLAVRGFEPGPIRDTMLLSHLLHAGTPGVRHSLAEVARRNLDVELSKELQQSDWSGPLSREQVEYSAADAAILIPLAKVLMAAVEENDVGRAAELENRCVPALVWMARSGVPVDVGAWKAVAAEVELDAERLRSEMDAAAPRQWVLDLGLGRNWDNTHVVRDSLRDAGIDITNVNDEALSASSHPLAGLLRQYRENRKLASTYGLDWLKHVQDGRAYPDWRQLGASSGRMACSNPNLQQIPRAQRYRSCIAAPAGRVLVKADFSQIELRIAARIAGEDRMLRAYQSGEDLHLITAQRVLGKPEITRSDRQLAKAINFGLLYGMGAEGFQRYARAQYGVHLSVEDAAHYRDAFFEAYPRLRAWHRANRDDHSTETRTLTGRRRFMDADTPLPLRLNTPVQGTGADGLKRSLALLWERRSQSPEAVPIIACHDEIVIECPADRAGEAANWLRRAMIDGMAPLIHPVPVEVEVSVGQTWAGGEPVAGALPAAPPVTEPPGQLSLF